MATVSIAILGLLVALSFGILALTSVSVAGIAMILSGILLAIDISASNSSSYSWLIQAALWRGGVLECVLVTALLCPCLFITERLRRERLKDDADFRHPRIFRLFTQPVLEVVIGAWLLPLAVAVLLSRFGVSSELFFSPRQAELMLPPIFLGGMFFWGLIYLGHALAKRHAHGLFQLCAMSIMIISVNFLGVVVTIVSAIAAYSLVYSVVVRPVLWSRR